MRMSTSSLNSKCSPEPTFLVQTSDGTLYLSNSLLHLQDVAENNNAIILDEQHVEIVNDDDPSSFCTEILPDNAVQVIDTEIQEEPKAAGSSNDEELTSLSWLQSTNLLQKINFTSAPVANKSCSVVKQVLKSEIASSAEESEIESSWDGSNLSYSDVVLPNQVIYQPQNPEGDEETKTSLAKPPHSFSMLIFLAIESSPSKALPVRDIYIWITKNFPYYCYAPVGWKNSVRHNLSLNKCFCKVERGPNIGKGSLWMVEPLHRPQLLQSLCKVPYIQTETLEKLMNERKSVVEIKAEAVQERKAPVVLTVSPPPIRHQGNMPDPKLFPYLSRRLAFNNQGPDVDAATAMLALGQSHRTSSNTALPPRKDYTMKKQIKVEGGHFTENSSIWKQENVATKTNSQLSPAEDHTYSFSPRGRTNASEGEPRLKRRSQTPTYRQDDTGDESDLERPAKVAKIVKAKGRGRGRGRGRGKGKWR